MLYCLLLPYVWYTSASPPHNLRPDKLADIGPSLAQVWPTRTLVYGRRKMEPPAAQKPPRPTAPPPCSSHMHRFLGGGGGSGPKPTHGPSVEISEKGTRHIRVLREPSSHTNATEIGFETSEEMNASMPRPLLMLRGTHV